MSRWLGVDVGGTRKGFDVALVDDHRLLKLQGHLDVQAVVTLVESEHPTVVGIDSPCCCAPEGQTARAGERQVNELICGIRWTADADHVYAGDYYAWVVHGLALFAALAHHRCDVIEVFPTASWTRWLGKRGARTRTRWSREGLSILGLDGVPTRTNQDQRDAIAAALTARDHARGATETLGEIVVPARGAGLPSRAARASWPAAAGDSFGSAAR